MAVAERIRDEDRVVWHLPIGPRDHDGDFEPILCGDEGEGINLPGHRENKPFAELCPDCRAKYQELGRQRRARFTGVVG